MPAIGNCFCRVVIGYLLDVMTNVSEFTILEANLLMLKSLLWHMILLSSVLFGVRIQIMWCHVQKIPNLGTYVSKTTEPIKTTY